MAWKYNPFTGELDYYDPTVPGGSDTQVQFNDGGAFGGKAGFTFNKTTDALNVPGAIHIQEDKKLYFDAT